MEKKLARQRRARRTRFKQEQLGAYRLCVHRTPRHTYAQLIDPSGSKVLVSASTVEPEVRKGLKGTGNIDAAAIVGKTIAERAKKLGLTKVSFDRSGYKYHGRVKALAEAARENGMQF